MFKKRGGIYKWSKASMNLEWWLSFKSFIYEFVHFFICF
jgi:hypothetical protein